MFTDSLRLISIFCLLGWPNLSGAVNWGQFEHDFDNEKPWSELLTQMPSYPQNENLLAFNVSPVNASRFFVDAKSINVGADGVVRYTLVIKAPGGAINIAFEGIRCENRMVKQYAYARPDGAWTKVRDPKWRDIVFKEYNGQHMVLHDDFFCPRKIIVSSAEEAVNALKFYGLHPNPSTEP